MPSIIYKPAIEGRAPCATQWTLSCGGTSRPGPVAPPPPPRAPRTRILGPGSRGWSCCQDDRGRRRPTATSAPLGWWFPSHSLANSGGLRTGHQRTSTEGMTFVRVTLWRQASQTLGRLPHLADTVELSSGRQLEETRLNTLRRHCRPWVVENPSSQP